MNYRKLTKILNKVKSHADEMKALSDEALQNKTEEFKERLERGETLDELLPEAFAAVAEADSRILGMYPYDVQIIGAIALHQGYLAEMNTGEGKTLAATMPLYLNALTGKSTILVTTNEYLALRDAEEMGKVYSFMGLTVRAGVARDSSKNFSNEEKKEIYNADIVYTTHGTLGFDYLFHNLVTKAEDRFLRPFYYVIIDEADSVMLDSASMPLVISGSPRVQSNLYQMADFFVKTLEEGVDYEKEERAVWLTEEGMRRAEEYFQIDNFYDHRYFELNRHVMLALRARIIMERERDYVIHEGEMYLLDHTSGRMLRGVKLRGGLHQAIEVKEGLEASRENRSMASITYQNLFLLFPKVAGMSGTIAEASDELYNVYGEKMVVIPPNKKLIRIDHEDEYYRDSEEQFYAAIDLAEELHNQGRPILMVATDIEETEIISQLLLQRKIPHNVLNANNAFWEADMIKIAGQPGAVTVSTNMAGRGTDIKLGPGVKELGGLYVIGVGRMINQREERQARGRAGRQGDPGESKFFVSLEDDIVTSSLEEEQIEKLEKKKYISKRRIKGIVNRAQKLSEERAVSARKQAFNYDEILQRQRAIIYEIRDSLLDEKVIDNNLIRDIAKENIRAFLSEKIESKTVITKEVLDRYILDNISYVLPEYPENFDPSSRAQVMKYLLTLVRKGLREERARCKNKRQYQQFLRYGILQAVDDGWVEEVDYLQQLQSAVSGRQSAQRNPIYEYQNEARASFQDMEKSVKMNLMRNVLLSDITIDDDGELKIVLP